MLARLMKFAMNPNSSPKIALLWESLFATVKGAVIGNIAIWLGVTLKGSLWLIIGGLALALLIL